MCGKVPFGPDQQCFPLLLVLHFSLLLSLLFLLFPFSSLSFLSFPSPPPPPLSFSFQKVEFHPNY